MTARAFPILLFTYGCVSPALDDQATAKLTGTTIVSLTFDDTFAEHYYVASLLEARGMHGTFYVNSPRFGASGYMSFAQVQDLEARGHEIAGHTLDHTNLTTVTVEEATREVCDDRNALLADGFAVASFAYPFGADSTTVQGVVQDCNYNSARDVGGLATPESCTSCPYANPLPPPNPYVIRTNGSIRNTTTLDAMKLYVTQAEDHGGGWVPMIFHHLCDSCDTYSVSEATLTAFLDWLEARGSQGTEVATVHQVMGGAILPPAGEVMPPPPPEPDNEPPTVRVTRPGDGDAVKANTSVWADATDNVGIRSVRFFVDGAYLTEDVEAPYKVKWNTSGARSGQHEIFAEAEDLAGNVSQSPSVIVTVR